MFLGLRVKETKEVYEGELTELTPTESENPLSGYGKTISHVVIGLKTSKGTKQLRLDPSIYEAIQKEKVVIGDVIYIEANTGAVKVNHFPFPIYPPLSVSLLNYIQPPLRGSAVQTPTHPNTTSKRNPTSLFLKETSTSARNSSKTSLFTISTWRTLDLRVDRTSCL